MLKLLPNHLKASSPNPEEPSVLFASNNKVGKATFNRPRALNSLSHEMMTLLKTEIAQWNANQGLQVVIFNGNGGKAFCAGSDLKPLYHAPDIHVRNYYFTELFQLCYQIGTMKPIQIALWDGIVIGIGGGLTLKAPIKIATENTKFSMPEAKIGLFLGFAGGYYFSIMKKHIGYFLGLTGHTLKGREVAQCGIADFYVRSENLPKLEAEIVSTTNNSQKNITVEELRVIVRKYAEPVENKYVHEDTIDKVFGKSSVEEIITELEKASQQDEFLKGLLSMIRSYSPVSLKVIFEQIKRGENLSFEENLKMDKRISARFMERKDFTEGVRSALIEKGYVPQWKFKNISEVPDSEVETYFNRLPEDAELELPHPLN